MKKHKDNINQAVVAGGNCYQDQFIVGLVLFMGLIIKRDVPLKSLDCCSSLKKTNSQSS